MLSAMDYGKRAIQRGRPNAFSYISDFEQAVEFMTTYVRIWQAWVRERGVLVSRYEDLLQDYDKEAHRLAAFLGIDVTRPAIGEVLGRFRPEQAEGRQGTHFFKGRIGRFREAFPTEQQAILEAKFGPELEKMGFPI
jgi:hypothetical protein